MFGRLLRLIVLILLAPAIAAFAYEAVLYIVSLVSFDKMQWFLLGLFLSVSLYVVALAGNVDFLEHLGHEVKHGCMSFALTWRLPSKMEIDPEKGSKVTHSGGGCLVTLAPYYLPMLTVPLLVLKPAVLGLVQVLGMTAPVYLEAALDALIGFTLGFEYVLVFKQFRFRQPDISKTGCLFSLVTVLFLNIMFLVLILTVVTNSYAEVLGLLKGGWARTKDYYQAAHAFLQDRVLPLARELLIQLLLLLCDDCAPQNAG